MSSSARQPLAAWRNEACAFPITVPGLDLTGRALRLQARFTPGAPGAALIDLATVTNGNAQGLRLLSVTRVDGVPTSVVQLRINKSTLQGLPYEGELGEPLELAYAFQIDGVTRMFGQFYILDSAIDSDNAPANRPQAYGRSSGSDATSGVVLTITDTGVTVMIDGADFVASAIATAEDARDAAEAAQEIASAGQILTRDPWRDLEAKLGPLAFGSSVYANGFPTTTKTVINAAVVGDSLGLAQGASAKYTIAAQVTATLQGLFPEATINVRVFAIAGSWQVQMFQQIDAMVAAGFDADIVFIFTGMNDATTTIFHSLEGPIIFRTELAKNIKRLRDDLGAVVCVVSEPLPHPVNSLANGRFDMSADFFMTYPAVGFVAGDGYQAFTYDAAAQTIRNSTPGAFKIFANGVLAPGQWIRIDPRIYGHAIFAHIWDWDEEGSVLFVDDGTGAATKADGARGGPILPSNQYSTIGLYQGKFNARTQIVPARNENDLSRPAGIAADIALAVEPRDINANGILINASLRHLTINRIVGEVAAQEGAILVPWGQEQMGLLTSNGAYDTLYSNGEDYHQNDTGYALFGVVIRRIFGKALFGLLTSGSGGNSDTSTFDARITTAQNTANKAQTDATAAGTAAGKAQADATAAGTAAGKAQADATAAGTAAGKAQTDATAAGTAASKAQADATSALTTKAPLASPALTGKPTAPTAPAGTITTQLATTQFVAAAIAAIINGAPGAMDQLNELAAAMGNDPNFSATMLNLLAGKLSAASNLSDLPNAATARTNLGLGSLATQSGTFSGVSSGNNTGDQTSVSGNAGTATKLATARKINGVPFDGTADVTVPGDTTPWTAYTPTQSAASGAIAAGTYYIGGRYKQIGKTVFFTAHLICTIPANAAGILYLGLPVVAVSVASADGSPNKFPVTGYDEAAGGILRAVIDGGASSVRITKLDGTTPFSGNMTVEVSGHYEAA